MFNFGVVYVVLERTPDWDVHSVGVFTSFDGTSIFSEKMENMTPENNYEIEKQDLVG